MGRNRLVQNSFAWHMRICNAVLASGLKSWTAGMAAPSRATLLVVAPFITHEEEPVGSGESGSKL